MEEKQCGLSCQMLWVNANQRVRMLQRTSSGKRGLRDLGKIMQLKKKTSV